MEPGRHVDPAEHFERTAESVAHYFGKPVDTSIIRACLSGIPEDTFDAIDCNPHEFASRVHAYLHNINYA